MPKKSASDAALCAFGKMVVSQAASDINASTASTFSFGNTRSSIAG